MSERKGTMPAEPLRRELDAQLLRRAFGQFATGVAIIGARTSDGKLIGMTVNSFASVSLEPPLVMFCPAKALTAYAVYGEARYFSASILSSTQQQVSEHFARKGGKKWAAVAHTLSSADVPLLDEAIACFECETAARYDAGDHQIVLGRVLALRIAGKGEPLIFHCSRYAHLARAKADAADAATFLAWGF
jgi:flavin reductase (DIM6/NTAB) family NADH-FMN oxidoreductase RutF